MIIDFTEEETKKIEEEVVKLCEKYPDARYFKNFGGTGPTCMYSKYGVENGPETPGCVIGQGIRIVCPEKFKEIEDIETNSRTYQRVVYWSMESAKQIFGEGLLSRIQTCQDMGKKWGEALKLARESLNPQNTINPA